jgi:hypothetical protein
VGVQCSGGAVQWGCSGGAVHQRGCSAIFDDKAKKIIRDKMRYSNLSNNMISEL